uniref:tol-pal system protein YbgF n=1 Tax=Thaumasiovibrio occultus TaxID=1891184 RepID=UPI000B354911|nr:tol-pal system protein YbgF [Thaumasiovibrio occultus]
MSSNIVRNISVLMLLSGAANAAPAPVTDLTQQSDMLARIEQQLEVRNQMQLQIQTQLGQLAGEIDELRGQVEQNSYQLNQMLDRQRDIYGEIDSLREQQSTAAAPTSSSSGDDVTYSSNVAENEAYDAAVALILEDKDFPGAITALNDFLAKYPNSVYDTNAHYWLGQLYFVQNQNEEAKTHFVAVSEKDDSTKRADALLKLGIVSERLSKVDDARRYYQAVIDGYPNSTSASQAAQNLGKL